MEFGNDLVQSQWKLATLRQLEEVVRREGAPLDVKHPQLTSLLAGLQSHSAHTTLTCSTILTTAVTQKWVEPGLLIPTLVSATVTTLHPTHTIHTIAEALLHQANLMSNEGNLRCPFSLRSHVHPFISIYTTSPDNGLSLVDQVVSMLNTSARPGTLTMTESFIKYILLYPTPSPQMNIVSLYLRNKLVDVVRNWQMKPEEDTSSTETSNALISLLVRTIPLGTSRSTADLLCLVTMAAQVADIITEDSAGMMVEILLSLISELTNRGLPSIHLIKSLCTLVEGSDKFGSVSHVLTVSALLFKSLPVPQAVCGLLKRCDQLIFTKVTKVTAASILLVLPLLQLLSQPATKSSDLVSTNQKAAAALLARIEDTPLSETTPDNKAAYCVFSQAQSLGKLYLDLCARTEKIVPFLKLFSEQCLKGLLSYDHLIIVLCALAVIVVRGVEGAVCTREILSTLTSIAQCDPTMGPSLLPFFIHLLSLSSCPHSKLAVLHSIPNLATHKLTTSSVLSTLRVVGGNPSLVSMATRLFGWTWEKQDHIFPSLLDYITQPLPRVSMATRSEIELSRMAVVRDICTKRAELHGETMLSVINGCIGSHDSVVVSMAIQGLTEVCRCEVVEVSTLWRVVGEKLAMNTTPVVMIALCSLFGLAADVQDSDKHSHKVFKTAALQYLFSALRSGHPKVCSAALTSLSAFQMTDLPARLQSHDQPSESPDESCDVPVTGEQLVSLFQTIPQESFPDHAHFLSNMLGQELETVGRGTISTALKQAQMPNQTDKVLSMLTTSLLQSSTQLYNNWMTIGAALSLGEIRVQSSPPGGRQVTQQLLSEQLSLMESSLQVCVTSVKSDMCEGLARLEAGKNWKKFMAGLLSLYAQTFLRDQRLLSVEEQDASIEDCLRARGWALSQVIKRLEQFIRGHPDSAGGVLTAFVAVVSSNISYLIGQPDHMTTRIDLSENLWILMEQLELLTQLVSADPLVTPPTPLTHFTPLTHPTPLTSPTTLTAMLRTEISRLQLDVWYALPVLVEVCVVLYVEGWSAESGLKRKLVRLAENLLSSLGRSSIWYIPEVINQILLQLLPLFSEVSVAMDQVVMQDKSMDSSALLPSLALSGRDSLFKTVMSSLTQILSTVSTDALTSTQAKMCRGHGMLDVQLCCVRLTSGIITGYANGCLIDKEAMDLVSLIADLATRAPQAGVYTLCLGGALYGLADIGHSSALSLCDTLAVRWLKELEEAANSQQQNQVIPLLWGLSALLGVSVGLRPIKLRAGGHSGYIRMLCPLVVQSFQRVQSSFSEESVTSTTVWLLTQIREFLVEYFSDLEKVPQDYSYLPPSSLLPSLYRLLDGYRGDSDHRHLKTAIVETVCKCEADLPPCNWSRLLVPYLRNELCQGEGDAEATSAVCVQRVAGFKQLTQYCTHPLILGSLKHETCHALLDSLPLLVRPLPSLSLGSFLHTTLTSPHHHTHTQLLLPLLRGIRKTLTDTNLPVIKKRILCLCVESAYKELLDFCWYVYSELVNESLQEKESLLWQLAVCLHQCDLKNLPSKDEEMLDCCYATAVECYLAMQGLTTFTSIERVLGWVLQNTEDPKVAPSFLLLLRVISTCCSVAHSNSTLHQVDALHMLLSWTRGNQVSSNQMSITLLLAHVATTTLRTTDPFTALISSLNQSKTVTEQLGILYSDWTEPKSSAVRKKLCECLVEWLGQTTSVMLKNTIIGIFSKLKTSAEYQTPLIWTSIGHLL